MSGGIREREDEASLNPTGRPGGGGGKPGIPGGRGGGKLMSMPKTLVTPSRVGYFF